MKQLYVAFDLGNVIVNVDLDIFINHLSEVANTTYEAGFSFLSRIQKFHDIGYSYFKHELESSFPGLTKEQYISLTLTWNKVISINQNSLNFLTRLFELEGKLYDRVNIAFLSNIGYEHAHIIKDFIPDKYRHKIDYYFSCEAGARKPHYVFYEVFLSMYPLYHGCYFFDDRVENLEAAEKFNFKPYHLDIVKFSTEELLTKEFDSIYEKIIGK